MEESYDVIIVGAGPAGASAAKVLVEHGLKTLVVEKRRTPVARCCSSIVSEAAMEFLVSRYGALDRGLFCENEDIISEFHYQNGEIEKLPIRWKNIHKPDFEKWLLERAKAEVITDCAYLGHEEANGLYSVELREKGKLRRVTSKYLISADGGYSKVRRAIQKKGYSLKKHLICIQSNYKIEEIDYPLNRHIYYVNPALSDLFTVTIVKDGILQLGYQYFLNNKHKKREYYEGGLKLVKEKYNFKGSFLISSSTLVYSRHKYNFGESNVLLIGEAAGFFTAIGEGIKGALVSGEAAAKSIALAEEKGGEALAYYKELIQDEVDYSATFDRYHQLKMPRGIEER